MRYKLRDYLPSEISLLEWQKKKPPDHITELYDGNCAMYYSNTMIKVLISIDTAADDAGYWLHMSVSRIGKIPSWDELKKAKETFFGNRAAVQLFPPKESWLSIAECLHLYSRLDADTVPPQIWRD